MHANSIKVDFNHQQHEWAQEENGNIELVLEVVIDEIIPPSIT